MKNLLVCTDGSNYSEQACRYAALLTKKTGAHIKALYVSDLRQFEIPALADLSGSLGIQPYDALINQLQEVEKLKSQFVGEQATKIFDEEGLSEQVTFHNETGLLVDEIKDYAASADMIVIGKRGENANFASEHLGSMLERVVRSAKVPCLVTNREFKPIKRVAIAYDGGESSRKALEYICSESGLFRSMELHLLVCVEGRDEDVAADRLSEAEGILRRAEFEPKCEILSGVVESAIAEYVEEAGIDLLVVGAYGHSRIRELLIGSTTTELMRRCHVPLLCFR
jgi:nucleotide-binding universal stress UspA family protein